MEHEEEVCEELTDHEISLFDVVLLYIGCLIVCVCLCVCLNLKKQLF